MPLDDHREWTLEQESVARLYVSGPGLGGIGVSEVVVSKSRLRDAEAELRRIKDEAIRVVNGACLRSWSQDIAELESALAHTVEVEKERDEALDLLRRAVEQSDECHGCLKEPDCADLRSNINAALGSRR